jgi:hypothetical protein
MAMLEKSRFLAEFYCIIAPATLAVLFTAYYAGRGLLRRRAGRDKGK